MSETTTTSTNPLKLLLGGLLAGLVVGLVLTGFVWSNLRGDLAQCEEDCAGQLTTAAEEQADLEARIGALEGQLETVQAQADLKGARILLSQGITDLDRRNFGTANDRIASAAERIATIDAETAEIDAEALSALEADLAGINVEVARDVMAQRAALGELAARIDGLLGL